ncbi:hypothetical protein [Roseicitreum antarcticum]|nr:hypothetical protein [Roseicitreum antarcticum]
MNEASMTNGQYDEVHEISKRLDRIISTGKWGLGLALPLFAAGLFSLWSSLGEVGNRVTSLESSRDSTAATLRRIDQNVDELARYLRDSGRVRQ